MFMLISNHKFIFSKLAYTFLLKQLTVDTW